MEPKQEFSWDKIQFQGSYDYLPVSLVFNEAQAIVLHDIPEGVYLTDVHDVVKTDNGFLIQYKGSNPIRLYDAEGKHIRQIGSIGAGPGEYSEITSFTYDYKNERIFVYDQWLSKIIAYDLQGSVLNEISEIITRYIFHHDGILYLFKPGNANEVGVPGFNNRLQVMDANEFQVIDELLPIKKTSLNSQANSKIFFTMGDTVILNPYFSNEIIKFHRGKVIEFIENIPGTAFLTEEEREEYVKLVLQRKTIESLKYFSEELRKFPGIFGLSIWNDPLKVIFSSNSGGANIQVAFVDGEFHYTNSFFDDLCSMSEIWRPIGLSNGYYIGVISSDVSNARFSRSEAETFKTNIQNWVKKMDRIELPEDFNAKFNGMADLVQKHTFENDEPPAIILLFR